MRPFFLIPALILAACGQQGDDGVQRVSLDALPQASSVPLPSPDIAGAVWVAAETRAAVRFGKSGQPPFLTLECADGGLVRIIRHAAADPGAKALFAVIGNGRISRLAIDAVQYQGGWRWEAALPISDPRLRAFEGGGEIEATLPGAGTLTMAGSRVPWQFLSDCRRAAAATSSARHSAPK